MKRDNSIERPSTPLRGNWQNLRKSFTALAGVGLALGFVGNTIAETLEDSSLTSPENGQIHAVVQSISQLAVARSIAAHFTNVSPITRIGNTSLVQSLLIATQANKNKTGKVLNYTTGYLSVYMLSKNGQLQPSTTERVIAQRYSCTKPNYAGNCSLEDPSLPHSKLILLGSDGDNTWFAQGVADRQGIPIGLGYTLYNDRNINSALGLVTSIEKSIIAK